MRTVRFKAVPEGCTKSSCCEGGGSRGCVLAFISAFISVLWGGHRWPLLGPPWENAGTGFPALGLHTTTPLDWSSSNPRGRKEDCFPGSETWWTRWESGVKSVSRASPQGT